ncbi:HEAT repeat domain-containing protein [Sporosarcina sp. P33]|uniref:HEAT repeat domain-containing protein n=1 Tax=Sporosarcina sp. P33 TaxID=1930764 RepID=UPI0009BDD2B4|nr:HEAT repeat domain-containing protein [Sporosarcina sp. P33]ARD47880.1 hypothetical protein SporoP33_06345 [Sporosarcina sp. P33]
MDKLLLTLLLIILFILLILFIMFFVLVYYRIQEVKKKEKIADYIKERQDEWYDYLFRDNLQAETLMPKHTVELEAIDELFFRLSYHFASEDISGKMNDFAKRYMSGYYTKQLNSRSAGVRINTLNKIKLFNLTFMAEEVLKQPQRKRKYSKTEYLLIYAIIAKFSAAEFVAHFIRPQVPLGEFDYKKLLIELEKSQIDLLGEKFDELPELLQLTLIEIAGVNYYLDWLPLLHQCLDSTNQELRIRALKSIAELEVADVLTLYKEFAYSPVWEERLMTAKILRSAPAEDALPVLNQLIGDSVYQVRAQAAKSMKSLRNGQQALYSVITTSSDEFAVDVAEEMFGKE